MEDGPQNIKNNKIKTKYRQRGNLLSEFNSIMYK